MTDPIVYSFPGIESVSAAIGDFVRQMHEHLSEVERTFNGLVTDGWTGAGADAFGGCAKRWNDNAGQMALTLGDLGRAVGEASLNMLQADHAAAATFD
jgi:WXG100 family type VII secretion target